MKRTNRVLPVYAADMPGTCSTLYELGGTTMMHDALGCDSTYITHDEPGWYSMDSMVHISALSELGTVMGDDEKLMRSIVDTTLNFCPAFIYIGGTPIPMMMGTGSKETTGMIENKTGTPTFGIATNRMHPYVRGIGEALRWVMKRLCPPGTKMDKPAALKVNMLEVTPLDFPLTGSIARLKDFLRSHGMETAGCWAMESGLGELQLAGLANINLVVPTMGLPVAAELKKVYGMPRAVGTPVGRRTSGCLAECIRQAARTGGNQSLFDGTGYVASWDANVCVQPDSGFASLPEGLSGRKALVIREQVIAGSLWYCLRRGWGADQAAVLCPIEGEKTLTLEGDIISWDEGEVIRTIAESTVAVADPSYRQVYPAYRNIVFVDFPHEARPGRVYHNIMRPFVCALGDSV